MQVGYNDSWQLELSASRDYQETHQCHQKPKSDKVLGELEAEARSGKGKKKKTPSTGSLRKLQDNRLWKRTMHKPKKSTIPCSGGFT